MCDPITATALTLTAVSGGMQAYGQYKEGTATKKYLDNVADLKEQQGKIELARGQKQSELIQDSAKFEGVKQKKSAAQVASAQRATLVANGIDLSSGTATDLVKETIDNARLDELAIRYNANIQSWNTTEDAKFRKWGLDVEASQARTSGANAKASGKRQAFTTLLSTAASMAGTAYLGGAFSGGAKHGTSFRGSSSAGKGMGIY